MVSLSIYVTDHLSKMSVHLTVCPQSVLWHNNGAYLDAVWDGEWGQCVLDGGR